MVVKRRQIKSCCGRTAFLLETDKPIRKFHISAFEGAGYTAPSNFLDIGIFYIRDHNIVASAPFGTKLINIKCFGENREELISAFEELLDSIVQKEKV